MTNGYFINGFYCTLPPLSRSEHNMQLHWMTLDLREIKTDERSASFPTRAFLPFTRRNGPPPRESHDFPLPKCIIWGSTETLDKCQRIECIKSSIMVFKYQVFQASLSISAMIQAFFSLYCLLKNTLPPKVFFKFFKEQNLFFFHKFDGF